jgi:hypothetical protein
MEWMQEKLNDLDIDKVVNFIKIGIFDINVVLPLPSILLHKNPTVATITSIKNHTLPLHL